MLRELSSPKSQFSIVSFTVRGGHTDRYFIHLEGKFIIYLQKVFLHFLSPKLPATCGVIPQNPNLVPLQKSLQRTQDDLGARQQIVPLNKDRPAAQIPKIPQRPDQPANTFIAAAQTPSLSARPEHNQPESRFILVPAEGRGRGGLDVRGQGGRRSKRTTSDSSRLGAVR